MPNDAVFLSRLIVNEISYRARMLAASFVTRGPKRVAINSLRRRGYYLWPGYFSPDEMESLDNACTDAMDKAVGVNDKPYWIARLPGAIRLRHLNERSMSVDWAARDPRMLVFNLAVGGRPTRPSMMYALTHDGSYRHDAVPGEVGQTFGDRCHFDQWHHQLKGIVFLSDVTGPEDGPLWIMPGTQGINWKALAAYRIKYANKHRGEDEPVEADDNVPDSVAAEFEREASPVPVLGKRGDLALFDTRTLHKAGALSRGARRLLWYYF